MKDYEHKSGGLERHTAYPQQEHCVVSICIIMCLDMYMCAYARPFYYACADCYIGNHEVFYVLITILHKDLVLWLIYKFLQNYIIIL